MIIRTINVYILIKRDDILITKSISSIDKKYLNLLSNIHDYQFQFILNEDETISFFYEDGELFSNVDVTNYKEKDNIKSVVANNTVFYAHFDNCYYDKDKEVFKLLIDFKKYPKNIFKKIRGRRLKLLYKNTINELKEKIIESKWNGLYDENEKGYKYFLNLINILKLDYVFYEEEANMYKLSQDCNATNIDRFNASIINEFSHFKIEKLTQARLLSLLGCYIKLTPQILVDKGIKDELIKDEYRCILLSNSHIKNFLDIIKNNSEEYENIMAQYKFYFDLKFQESKFKRTLKKLVFLHELGHCAFDGISNFENENAFENTVLNERRANYFTSLFSDYIENSFIWFKTNFQTKKYKNPILKKYAFIAVKVNDGTIQLENAEERYEKEVKRLYEKGEEYGKYDIHI